MIVVMRTSSSMCSLWLLALLLVGPASAFEPQANPGDLAPLVANQILNNTGPFFQWEYGQGIIFEALWETLSQFKGLSYDGVLDEFLDQYETTPGDTGYNVLNNIVMPWPTAVGDSISLFPIAYLARNKYYLNHKNPKYDYNNKTDLLLSVKVADEYLIPFPYRLPDGTYSRANGWTGQPAGNHTFVWADDSFMGTALLARLAILYNEASYLNTISGQQLTYAMHLRDEVDGLFHHGYNNEDHEQSCCKWGRANGWLMMSHVEVLSALEYVDNNGTQFQQILEVFLAHARAAAKVQSSDGRWHQVLNESSTFLETSATGMFLLSFITGVQHGWLDKAEFDPVIQSAWNALARTVEPNGVVTGICEGTGIGTNVSFYENRNTDYLDSAPGLGSVLKAIVAMQSYL